MRYLYIYILSCLCIASTFAQSAPKQLEAFRMDSPIKIDGQLDEAVWRQAPIASDFVQNDPIPGGKPSQKTNVQILYDNQAIYIGAMLYDTQSDSIMQELSERDNIGNTDWFGILIDAYQDGQNATGFYVTSAGVQIDTKYSTSGGNNGPSIIQSGDSNWDAVWSSQTQFTDAGWVVEMRLPYSALRFPNVSEQKWNINFGRMLRRDREQSFWNEVDPTKAGFVQQSGVLNGIREIKAPVRLSATPFVAGYVQNYFDKNAEPKSTNGYSINGGMDVKYGINDAFTLDMTLIPDFGEAQSDNQVQNLSPFEVRFDENRQFFTEGIELFNKGNLFYSRRVGGRPLHYWDAEDQLGENEVVVDNPIATQLYNATKISGRTKKGLGVGFFNAVASQMEATIRNEETGDERRFQTNPLTNYNVLVLDQNLKNNSSVSFVNTNVMRTGRDYDANVTGAQFSLQNKANSYQIGGRTAVSQKYYADSTDLGHTYNIGVGKISGNYNWEAYFNEESYDYDPNDLGFLFSPNERNFGANMDYKKYTPFWKYFNSGGWGAGINYNRLQRPSVFNRLGIFADAWVRTNAFVNIFMWGGVNPVESFDYFEPRRSDFSRYFKVPLSGNHGFWISTDYRKKFALDLNGNARYFKEKGRFNYDFEVIPRIRFSNKLFVSYGFEYTKGNNDVGYVDDFNTDIIFGKRDRQEVENTLRANYSFNNKMTLSFRLRHYWASVKYNSFHRLDEDGYLAASDYDSFNDGSFNAFNIDAIYRWRFAPGSDIFVIWKNSVLGSDDERNLISYSYGDGFNRLSDLPQSNSLSLKVIYYLDYLSF